MNGEIEKYTAMFYSKDKATRDAGAKGLGGLGKEGAVAASKLLNDEDWHIRYRACEALGFAKVGAEFLYPMLCDEKDHVRYMAAKSLGFCNPPDLKERILPLLSDENEFVVRIANKILSEQ